MSTAQAQRKSFMDSDTSTPEMPLRRVDTPVVNCRAPAKCVTFIIHMHFYSNNNLFIACLCRVVEAALRKLQTPEPQILRASEKNK